jgi:hypothetical protein
MIGAYREVPAFAYPGWRLSVPGGPAGGHYKGFTHTQAAGTDIPPQDQYEQDREDGMSSHDLVHATQRNPRGVYRSSGEVPPRPNASGRAHSYRSFQTQRHAGTAIAPGSFPAEFVETDEDAFIHRYGLHGLGALPISEMIRVGVFQDGGGGNILVRPPVIPTPPMPGPAQTWHPPAPGAAAPVVILPIQARPNCITDHAAPPPGMHYESMGTDANGCELVHLVHDAPPATGATSVVNQPPAHPAPLPPSPSVPVVVAPPVSPAPAPVVNTNQVVPLNDGSGNFLNVSTGTIVPSSAVAQNPATGQLTSSISSAASGALSWLEQPSTFFPAVPNWGLVAGAAVLASMLMGGKRR